MVKDDTLWDLSKKYLPNVGYWKKFQKLNGISYPKRLTPGAGLQDRAGRQDLYLARPAVQRGAGQQARAL